MKNLFFAIVGVCLLMSYIEKANAQLTCFYSRIVDGNSVELHWCISQPNIYGSDVQRRGENGVFASIPNSFCPGFSPPPPPLPIECVFTDRGVPNGIWFYRIRTIDLDGTFRYSDSLRVEMGGSADYVIITPSAYVNILQPLAAYRSAHNGFEVRIVTTDSIYSQFGQQTSPDTAIRRFITFALTSWSDPKPQYFLLAGNVNTVPSHKEHWLGPTPDSVTVDQWFVEGAPDTSSIRRPAAAIGRFPAWTAIQLARMVSKTIAYETSPDSTWARRAIAVADSGTSAFESSYFESQVAQHARYLAPVWRDTQVVHTRRSSLRYRSRRQFFNMVNDGASINLLLGHGDSFRFATMPYFTTWDVDSLSSGFRLPFWIMVTSHQGFDRSDTIPTIVNLMQADNKGAVATFSSPDLVYTFVAGDFVNAVLQTMTVGPDHSIGKSILITKRAYRDASQYSQSWKWNLLGDPALTLKTNRTTDVSTTPIIAHEYQLMQNYPNPFNPTTRIEYAIPRISHVSLKVFDVLGREVATLVDEVQDAGFKSVTFNASALASGVYFYTLNAGDYRGTKRMLLMK